MASGSGQEGDRAILPQFRKAHPSSGGLTWPQVRPWRGRQGLGPGYRRDRRRHRVGTDVDHG